MSIKKAKKAKRTKKCNWCRKEIIGDVEFLWEGVSFCSQTCMDECVAIQ